MTVRCKLCRRRIVRSTDRVQCECGWVMDDGCNERHHAWCLKHGEDRWVGAVEL